MLLYCRGIVTFFFMETINLIVPREWHEFDDKQLRYLFVLFDDDYSLAEIRTPVSYTHLTLPTTPYV